MKTIFLSPHLDDAVFSCGGWIWEQTQKGRVIEIWTICAGDPPDGDLSSLAVMLHENWELGRNAIKIRRQEDQMACQLLGAEPYHFPFLDCIYRKKTDGEAYYQSEMELFGGLDTREGILIDEVSHLLEERLPERAQVMVPLGIGNHVDHELTRKAASRLGRELHYFADYPYAREGEGGNILRIMEESNDWHREQFAVSSAGLERWVQASLLYSSQIPTFWEDENNLRSEIRNFSDFLGGMTLWTAVEE